MMTQDKKLPLRINGLDDYQMKVIDNSPAWLKGLRQRGVAQFIQNGIPTVKDEEYKYTSLVELTSRRFQLASTYKLLEEDKLAQYMDKADINVVIVNGQVDLSHVGQLPKGLTITTVREAGAEVENSMTKVTSNDTKGTFALNQALFLDGVCITVADKAIIEPLVHIIHVTSDVEENTALFPRSVINVGKAAQASFLESYISFEDYTYWTNAATDLRVGEDANVQYCKAEAESKVSFHTGATRVWQERASTLDLFTFSHNAHLVRNNLSILLKGEGTNTIMNGFYALDNDQHVDNHTLLDIQHPNCTSYQLYKGILNDRSRAVFNGKIYVHADAQKTNGYQLNKHLLLGKDARIDTKPQLEIFADDVKCTHGATIGQLSEDEIFYLQSRCIAKETAIQLLSHGFIDDIINTIKSDAVRNKLSALLSVKFPAVKL